MTPLFRIFVEAMEQERRSLYIGSGVDGVCVIDCNGKQVSPLYQLHCEAERFIAERAAVAGVRAVREALPPTRDVGLDHVDHFLSQLAGEHDD